MRTVSLWALALMALMALVLIPTNLNCGGRLDCLNYLVWLALAVLLGFIGFVLALSAAILGVVRTVKRRQWGWCVGLVVGVLAPLPAGIVLNDLLVQVYYSSAVLPSLPFSAGLVFTPVVALIYSWRFPGGAAAAERSSSPVPHPAAETLGEPAPPPLDAP